MATSVSNCVDSAEELDSILQGLTINDPTPSVTPTIALITPDEGTLPAVEAAPAVPSHIHLDVEDIDPGVGELRPYQARIVRKVTGIVAKHSVPPALLVYLPTGGGKTRIASELFRKKVSAGGRCLFVVNRNKLADQAYESMLRMGLRRCTAVYKSGHEECLDKPIQIASIQSLRSESRVYPPASLVVIDEAHCALADSVRELVEHYKELGSAIVGLTATPMRLDPSQQLSEVFQKLIRGPSITELVSSGVIVPPVAHLINLEDVKRKLKGSRPVKVLPSATAAKPAATPATKPATLSEMIKSSEWVKDAVRAWRRVCAGRKTICFCVDIQHSMHLATAFTRKGIEAAHIDGSMAEGERDKLYAAFARGTLTVLTSVNVLSEGFDQPDIEAVMLLRPTASKGLYIQMVGRGLRCSPGKRDCIVLDQSGNTMVHGPITGPSGYAPEPWGDDNDDVTASKAGKPKLWKLVPCLGDCGAVLHAGVGRCAICVRSPDSPGSAAQGKGRRAPLSDVTNSGRGVECNLNVEAKLIAAWSASVKLNDGGDAEEESMPIPRKEKKAV